MASVPDFLTKHGITGVRDNLEIGQGVAAPVDLMARLLADDFMAAITSGKTTAKGGELCSRRQQ